MIMPALIKKIYDAHRENRTEVIIWGTGKPYREFLYVDDLADAVIYLMNNYTSHEPINIGTGKDITMQIWHILLLTYIGYKGNFIF